MTTIIKIGRIKKGSPLDKKEYGFRILISQKSWQVLRWVKTAERKLYYDDWWNGTKSGNIRSRISTKQRASKIH